MTLNELEKLMCEFEHAYVDLALSLSEFLDRYWKRQMDEEVMSNTKTKKTIDHEEAR